jgi:hypothetical protein
MQLEEILSTNEIESPVFSKHVRNRANALIHLLPFPHIYQNVLRAIAYYDWHQSTKSGDDYRVYLDFAKVKDDHTAITYLDWLEPRLRLWLNRYEQLLAVHSKELQELIDEGFEMSNHYY